MPKFSKSLMNISLLYIHKLVKLVQNAYKTNFYGNLYLICERFSFLFTPFSGLPFIFLLQKQEAAERIYLWKKYAVHFVNTYV